MPLKLDAVASQLLVLWRAGEPGQASVPIQVAAESKMTVDVEEYVSSFRTDLCDVLAAWSRGAKFGDIMKMTDVFEVGCRTANLAELSLPAQARVRPVEAKAPFLCRLWGMAKCI